MTRAELKKQLHQDLNDARSAVLWKLQSLNDYDVRRPMVPSGTNLLGLIKHLATMEVGYFGDTFHRPFTESLPWFSESAEPNADMWATLEETREQMVDLYRRAQAHADSTIESLDLDAIGHVPWWPEDQNGVTLERMLAYMIAETNRHAGHADILRELIDGAVGWRKGDEGVPSEDRSWWEGYRRRLEQVALEAREPA